MIRISAFRADEFMGGSVVMNGSYSTATSVKNPDLNAGFKMNGLSFAQAYKELDMVQKMAPIFENIKGNFSGNMNIATKLDQQMSPVFTTTQGSGSLSTKDISLSGVNVIDKIATAVKKESLKNMAILTGLMLKHTIMCWTMAMPGQSWGMSHLCSPYQL